MLGAGAAAPSFKTFGSLSAAFFFVIEGITCISFKNFVTVLKHFHVGMFYLIVADLLFVRTREFL